MKQLVFEFAKTPVDRAVELAVTSVFLIRGNPPSVPMFAVLEYAIALINRTAHNNSDLDASHYLSLREQARESLIANPDYKIIRGKQGGVFKQAKAA